MDVFRARVGATVTGNAARSAAGDPFDVAHVTTTPGSTHLECPSFPPADSLLGPARFTP
jgi:hypothetical protein